MEQVQVIVEKEMTSKLMKQFTVRSFIYSFVYFATIIMLFIFNVKSVLWSMLLVVAINILFLMILSRMATIEAFDGINTTSAPKQSLIRILNTTAVPLFIVTGIFSFIDIIFLHSLLNVENGYTTEAIGMFVGVIAINFVAWSLVVNIYEKSMLKKFLIIEDEIVEKIEVKD